MIKKYTFLFFLLFFVITSSSANANKFKIDDLEIKLFEINKLVKSSRGATGGYLLEKPPSEIKISNIIFAVDEEVKMLNCKKNSKKGCNNKSSKCITHNLWDELDQHIHQFFEKVKLQDLVRGDIN